MSPLRFGLRVEPVLGWVVVGVLRAYQTRAVDDLREAVRQHRHALYVLPTGAGKTVVGSDVVSRAAAKGTLVLWLTHRRELIDQTFATMREAIPDTDIGVVGAGWPETPWASIQIAMIQTLAKRELRRPPGLIMVDEAHHTRAKTWAAVLERWPDTPRIGLTATPQRLDGRGLGEHFAAMVEGPSVAELIDQKFLSPVRMLTVPEGFAVADLPTNRAGDFQRKAVEAAATKQAPRIVAAAAEAYLKYGEGRQAIFFGVHRSHSRSVAEKLQAAGVAAVHVDGADHVARRQRVMAGFRRKAVTVVCNCDLISEGFDAPSCEVVMLGAPTKSVTRYLQWVGRSMRFLPGKTALGLDLAGNTARLGLPDDPRHWSLDDGEIVDGEIVKRAPRVCRRCHAAFRGLKCPQCLLVPEPQLRVLETDVELVEAKRRAVEQEYLVRREKKIELSRARRSDNPRAALEDIAEMRGYHPRWVDHRLRIWGLSR